MGGVILRTASLYAAFFVASAVLARTDPWSLAAHQIGMQIFNLLALVLDAIAIAGQVIVGRNLGAGDGAAARSSAIRMIELSVAGGLVIAVVLLALIDVIPRAFTSDPRVIEQAQELWPLLAVMQPFGAAVFALDGILLGAGETTYLAWTMLLARAGLHRDRAAVTRAGLGRRRRLGRLQRVDPRAAGDAGTAVPV